MLLPDAEKDIDSAWYEGQREGLSQLFLEELGVFKEKLKQNPSTFNWVNTKFRQAILQRFPYVILFEVLSNNVIIYAVLHTSRNNNSA